MGPQHPQVLNPKAGQLIDDSPHKRAGPVVSVDLNRPPLDLGAELVERSELCLVVVREFGQDLAFYFLLFFAANTLSAGAQHFLYGPGPRNQQQTKLAA